MKKITSTILLLLVISFLWAGRYAGDFMQIGAGVQSLAMGGAYGAVADDGSAIYWNAAGLGQIQNPQFSLMRSFLYEGLATYDYFSYCQSLPANVTIGISWTRLTVDDIPIYSESHLVGTNVDQRASLPSMHLTGIPDGKFTATDDLFQFAFAKHVHKDINMGWLFFDVPLDFYFAGNIKYIKRKILNNFGTGTGFDLSFLFKSELNKLIDEPWLGTFRYGVNLQDVGGTKITWDTDSNHEDEVLYNTKVAVAYEQPITSLDSKVLVSYDQDYVYGHCRYIGMRWQYANDLSLLGGYTFSGQNTHWSTGASVKLYNIFVDYAFVRMNDIARDTHRIGLRLEF